MSKSYLPRGIHLPRVNDSHFAPSFDIADFHGFFGTLLQKISKNVSVFHFFREFAHLFLSGADEHKTNTKDRRDICLSQGFPIFLRDGDFHKSSVRHGIQPIEMIFCKCMETIITPSSSDVAHFF